MWLDTRSSFRDGRSCEEENTSRRALVADTFSLRRADLVGGKAVPLVTRLLDVLEQRSL